VKRRLAGKRAIVTGGAQGIGRASVEAFVIEGAQVVALDINASALAELRAQCGCETQVIDLTNASAITEFAVDAGDIDILFLCAGKVATGTILEYEERDWASSFDLNVTAMYRIIRALLPRMIQRQRGSIITMSSVASSVRGVPDRFAYATTKAAVIGLTKAIAADHVTQGIRCVNGCTNARDGRL
jgi:2-keto-3-deoxy-L-fuconate dehydrogenase